MVARVPAKPAKSAADVREIQRQQESIANTLKLAFASPVTLPSDMEALLEGLL